MSCFHRRVFIVVSHCSRFNLHLKQFRCGNVTERQEIEKAVFVHCTVTRRVFKSLTLRHVSRPRLNSSQPLCMLDRSKPAGLWFWILRLEAVRSKITGQQTFIRLPIRKANRSVRCDIEQCIICLQISHTNRISRQSRILLTGRKCNAECNWSLSCRLYNISCK